MATFLDEIHTAVVPLSSVDPAKPDYVRHAERQAEEIREERHSNESGLESGSIGDSIQKTSAAAVKDAQNSMHEKAERKAKEQADDLFFLSLLQDEIDVIDRQVGFLEDQINKLSETIDGMIDGSVRLAAALEQENVKRAIKEWESRHPGREFDADAEDAPELLLSILQEQKDIDSGNVTGLKKRRQDLSNAVDEAHERIAAGAPVESVKADIESRFPDVDRYATQQALGVDSEARSEISDVARDTQDDHSDLATDTEAAASMELDDFGSLALNSAGEDFLDQFKKASAAPDKDITADNSVDTKPDLGMGIS